MQKALTTKEKFSLAGIFSLALVVHFFLEANYDQAIATFIPLLLIMVASLYMVYRRKERGYEALALFSIFIGAAGLLLWTVVMHVINAFI